MKVEKNEDKNLKDMYIAPDFKEIVDGVNSTPDITKEEAKKLIEGLKESIDFVDKLDEIKLNEIENRIIFTDGEIQLAYENGEYYLISTTDSKKVKKKIKKQEAKDMYLEYFIKYQLNPLLAKAKNKAKVKTKEKVVKKENLEKTKVSKIKKTAEKEVTKPEVKKKVKIKEDESISR